MLASVNPAPNRLSWPAYHQKLSNNDDPVDGDLSGIVRKALITFVVKIHSQRFL